jgi:hypothetical protein
MTMLHTKSAKKNEKGVALIFTLIMLSLLLILALSFTMDSMFEQKAAYNSANASSASSLAQVQLKQILTLVENDNATNFTTGNVYSIPYTGWVDPSTISNTNKPELIDMLKDRFPVYGILDENNDNSCLEPVVKVNWNYIKNDDLDGRIIGRAAYIIIPDEKIPLPSLVDGRDVVGGVYPKHNDELDTETRIGKYVSEINVRYAIPAVTNPPTDIDTIAKVLSWKQSGNVGFPNGEYEGNWVSFADLFTAITDSPNAVALSDSDKTEFQKNLNIRASDDEEAFWADANNNSKLDAGELYRRFNLARTDWDKTTWADDLEFMREQILMLTKDDTSTVPVHSMQSWDKTDGTASTSGLPWLALFGYDKDGASNASMKMTFASVYDRRCQIAANLKDYCDKDKNSSGNYVDIDGDPIVRPTSDVDPANWKTTEPNFTGNEQTPYINKVGVQVEITRKDLTGQSKALLEITPWVGLVNIYQVAFPTTSLEVEISGKVYFKATGYFGSSPEVSVSFTKTITYGGWSSGLGYSNFGKGSSEPGETDYVICDPLETLDVDIEKVEIEKVILYKNNGASVSCYDYTKRLDDGGSLSNVFTGAEGSFSYCWYGWAVHDPRQNLNKSDWLELTHIKEDNDAKNVLSLTGDGSGGNPYIGMPNAENSSNGTGDNTNNPSVISSNYGDKESSSDPVGLSTAHIGNAPMESPWELGFISRGVKWQTINLKKYNIYKAIKTFDIGSNPYIPGGEFYKDGDANILDQIKMVPDAKSPQKINLNCSVIDGFKALLTKVKYGCDIDSTMSVNSMAGIDPTTGAALSGTELAATDVTTIGKAIIEKYESNDNSEERLTRASVVDKLLLTDATTPALATVTDAKQEELIAKVVNLTKIGRQTGHFTIIVLAQTIKDIGGTGGNTIDIYKNSEDGTYGNKPCEIGVFDAYIDLTNPAKSIYYDEITAEQKIMLKGRALGGGQIKIISFQYID